MEYQNVLETTSLSMKRAGSELGTECPENAIKTHFEVENLVNDGFVSMGAEVDVEPRQVGAVMEMDQNRKEAPPEGISLVVEVFGPLNGNFQPDNTCSESEHVLEGKETADNKEHKVGDLVWAKTKTQVWWPGTICDPTAASKDVRKTDKVDKADHFLVKYFGSTNTVWCSASGLKPFIEHIDQMAKQNKSRSFVGAVDRALLEIGQRVKREMSCSCSLKERETANYSKGDLGFFSASVFEPAKFLESVRNQALNISSPGSIEFEVMKNCLSAYYSSVGHKQLPMHQLRPRNDAGDEAKGEESNKLLGDTNSPLGYNMNKRKKPNVSAENVEESSQAKLDKSFELRERKKSKYLSYPYVNSWENKDSTSQGTAKTEDSQAGADSKNISEQSQDANCNARKKLRKCRTFKSIYGKVESVDKSSTEMLQELWWTAVDCLRPNESKDSASTLNFFYGFRKHSFLNQNISSMDNSQQQSDGTNLIKGDKGEKVKVPRKRKKKETTTSTNPEIRGTEGLPDLNGNTVSLSVENMEVTGPDTSKGKLEPKRAKNKEAIGSGASAGASSSELQNKNINGAHFIPVLKDLKPECKKRKREEKASVVPDLNSTGKDSADCSAATSQENKRKKRANMNTLILNFTSGQPLPSKESLDSTLTQFGPLVEPGTQYTSESTAQVVFILSHDAEVAYRSIEKNSPFGTALASFHLNPSQDKPRQRRRKTTPLNVVRSTGNKLFLNFAAGHPLPSVESLNDTLIRFGPVVESETRFLTDTSAQVVFSQSRDAELAYRSLKQNSLFGPALVSFHLDCPLKEVNYSNVPKSSPLMEAIKLPPMAPPNGEPPDLMYMKQNLEMMTAILEKSGDKIPPEMKANLESEIKGFLKKINSMIGSSPSSS